MMEKRMDIQNVSYHTVKEERYDYAVLPWGATEPHNYHLPYLTDCYLAHGISLKAVLKTYERAKFQGMVLPPIPFGSQNPGQRELPFCLHARYETQRAILNDIVASLDYQGIHTLVIVNGHGGNSFKNMVRDLAVDYPQMTITVSDFFTVIPQADYFENKDDHAGEMETSLMLYFRPDLVDMAVAGSGAYKPFKAQTLQEGVAWMPRDWSKVSQDTGIGNPLLSTAEKGERYAEAVTDKLAILFEELVRGNIYD